MPPSLAGRLLVATPVIGDPNFERTVVLILEHGPSGALGLVLNRPTEIGVADPLPAWAPWVATPEVVFAGGPVEQHQAVALAELSPGAHEDGFDPVLGQVGTIDLSREPGASVRWVRVFAGYAGWGPGQLEGELGVGAWFVVAAEPADVCSASPATLWEAVLRRQGQPLCWFAGYPDDVTRN